MRDAAAAAKTLGTHVVALVLGSGWAEAVAGLPQAGPDIRLADIPGFDAPTAAGHGAVVRSHASS